MSVHEYIEKMKALHEFLLRYIDDDNEVDSNYQNLITYLNDQK